MKLRSVHRPRGFTLVELSLVIGLLIALASIGMLSTTAITKWQAGREASETLRSVYVAQRTFLADHPTTAVGSLTQTNLLPYVPNKPAAFPTVKGLDGVSRAIKVNISPPVIVSANGSVYDPSGDFDDSLWDVGE